MYFHIILTEKCNSQCRYCYEKSMKEFDNGLQNKFDFDFDSLCDYNSDIKKLKKFIEQDKEPKIIFYGGEPLLQIEKIKEIMNNIKAKFYIQTNGKLLNKLDKEYLNKILRILVSIDGNKKRTDYNRGEGTFDLVINNIREIKKNNFKGEIVARMTIAQDCPDIFEQVKNIFELNLFDSVHWQLDAGFYKNDFSEKEFIKFVKKYNNSILELINLWVQKMRKGKVLKIYPFLGIFESIYFNKPTKLRCGAGYANYTITTDGKITACPIMNNMKDFYCGDLDSRISELKKIGVGEPCDKCNYLNICGGRCLYSNKTKLWPQKGQKLICKTIIHLIKEIKNKIPEIKNLIEKNIISEEDFDYEKYFGPEIIP